LTLKYLYIQIKSRMKNKVDLSLSISPEILKKLKIKFINRTKFIEYCIITELSKDVDFKDKLKKINKSLWEIEE